MAMDPPETEQIKKGDSGQKQDPEKESAEGRDEKAEIPAGREPSDSSEKKTDNSDSR